MSGGASNIIHYGSVRIRCVGSGMLDLQLQGYDDILTLDLVSVPLLPTNKREETRLCNFTSQYARLRGSTSEINEIMRVNSIIIFVKEIYGEYPSI